MWGVGGVPGERGRGEGGSYNRILLPRKYAYGNKLLTNYMTHVSICIFVVGLRRGVLHI
jgi:hypothetical protein